MNDNTSSLVNAVQGLTRTPQEEELKQKLIYVLSRIPIPERGVELTRVQLEYKKIFRENINPQDFGCQKFLNLMQKFPDIMAIAPQTTEDKGGNFHVMHLVRPTIPLPGPPPIASADSRSFDGFDQDSNDGPLGMRRTDSMSNLSPQEKIEELKDRFRKVLSTRSAQENGLVLSQFLGIYKSKFRDTVKPKDFGCHNFMALFQRMEDVVEVEKSRDPTGSLVLTLFPSLELRKLLQEQGFATEGPLVGHGGQVPLMRANPAIMAFQRRHSLAPGTESDPSQVMRQQGALMGVAGGSRFDEQSLALRHSWGPQSQSGSAAAGTTWTGTAQQQQPGQQTPMPQPMTSSPTAGHHTPPSTGPLPVPTSSTVSQATTERSHGRSDGSRSTSNESIQFNYGSVALARNALRGRATNICLADAGFISRNRSRIQEYAMLGVAVDGPKTPFQVVSALKARYSSNAAERASPSLDSLTLAHPEYYFDVIATDEDPPRPETPDVASEHAKLASKKYAAAVRRRSSSGTPAGLPLQQDSLTVSVGGTGAQRENGSSRTTPQSPLPRTHEGTSTEIARDFIEEDEGISPVFLNTHEAFSALAIADPGWGKSSLAGLFAEACVLEEAHDVVKLRQKMCVLACYYDTDPLELPALLGMLRRREYVSFKGDKVRVPPVKRGTLVDQSVLEEPSTTTASSSATGQKQSASIEEDTEAFDRLPVLHVDEIVVLVSPSFYFQRLAFYRSLNDPRIQVYPLLFELGKLDAGQIRQIIANSGPLTSVGSQGASQHHYLAGVANVLRRFQTSQHTPTLKEFEAALKAENLQPQHTAALFQRISFLKSILTESDENKSLAQYAVDINTLFEPGKVIIVDLNNPILSGQEVNNIFSTILSSFRQSDRCLGGKLAIFEDAHRYLGSETPLGRLGDLLVDTCRQSRHQGMRVVVTAQNPSQIPAELFEVASMTILGTVSSSLAVKNISTMLSLPEAAKRLLPVLEHGEAYVVSNKASVQTAERKSVSDLLDGADYAPKAFRLVLRHPLTQCGSVEILNGFSLPERPLIEEKKTPSVPPHLQRSGSFPSFPKALAGALPEVSVALPATASTKNVATSSIPSPGFAPSSSLLSAHSSPFQPSPGTSAAPAGTTSGYEGQNVSRGISEWGTYQPFAHNGVHSPQQQRPGQPRPSQSQGLGDDSKARRASISFSSSLQQGVAWSPVIDQRSGLGGFSGGPGTSIVASEAERAQLDSEEDRLLGEAFAPYQGSGGGAEWDVQRHFRP